MLTTIDNITPEVTGKFPGYRAPSITPEVTGKFPGHLPPYTDLEPVGFWDPLGLTAGSGLLAFKRHRCLKPQHGRISMLAAMSYITPDVIGKFPGYMITMLACMSYITPDAIGKSPGCCKENHAI